MSEIFNYVWNMPAEYILWGVGIFIALSILGFLSSL